MREIDGLTFWEARGGSYFCELSGFGALSDKVTQYLLREGKVIALDAGDTIFSVGDRSDAFYIVLAGAIDTWMPGQEERMSFVRRHEAGEEVGFAAMIALRDKVATTVAHSDSVVLEVSSDLFFKLHEKEAEAFGLMMLNLTRGMARALINMAVLLSEKGVRLPGNI